MEYRPLDLTIISAEDLKDVNFMSKMNVYVIVSLSGDPRTRQRTPVDKDAGKNPRWNNHALRFSVYESALKSPNLCLSFKIISDRIFGDREIGEVSVPVKELFDSVASEGIERVAEYKIRTVSGKMKGTLKFSYKFGDKIAPHAPPHAAPMSHAPPRADLGKNSAEPVTAYPAPPMAGYGQPGFGQAGYGQPYAYPPYGQPQVYTNAYGVPHQQYGYGPQVVQPQKKKKHGGLGLGLGAGLLGGLLIGDMIGDVGEMSSYDAGYDAGFDDGGFDF